MDRVKSKATYGARYVRVVPLEHVLNIDRAAALCRRVEVVEHGREAVLDRAASLAQAEVRERLHGALTKLAVESPTRGQPQAHARCGIGVVCSSVPASSAGRWT